MTRDLDELFKTYSESLGSCQRIPRRKPVSPLWYLAPCLVALGSVGLVAYRALTEETPEKTFNQMLAVVDSVSRVDIAESRDTDGNTVQNLQYIRLVDGSCYERLLPGESVSYSLSVIGEQVKIDYDKLPYATTEPLSSVGLRGGGDTTLRAVVLHALDPVRSREDTWIESKSNHAAGVVKLELAHPTGSTNKSRAELYIDKLSHLLLGVTTYHASPMPAVMQKIPGMPDQQVVVARWTFSYWAVPSSSFRPNGPDKPIYDLPLETMKLSHAWQHDVQVAPGARFVDACQTADGSVWVVSRRIQKTLKHPYDVGVDLEPTPETSQFCAGGPEGALEPAGGSNDLTISMFHPLVAGKAPPLSEVVIRYQVPRDSGPYYQVAVPLRREVGDVPSYVLALHREDLAYQLGVNEDSARAVYYSRAGNFTKAAAFFRAAAGDEPRHEREFGYRSLLEAADADQKAGQKQQRQHDIRAADDVLRDQYVTAAAELANLDLLESLPHPQSGRRDGRG